MEVLESENTSDGQTPPRSSEPSYSSSSEYPRSSKDTMLIVDDAEDMVAFLKDSFCNQYEVITASDGIEALDLLKKHARATESFDEPYPLRDAHRQDG